MGNPDTCAELPISLELMMINASNLHYPIGVQITLISQQPQLHWYHADRALFDEIFIDNIILNDAEFI